MKTPEDIKNGLERCQLDKELLFVDCSHCPYYLTVHCDLVLHADALAYIQQLEDAIDKTTQLMQSATEVIKKSQEQLESTYSQVKKALCGKENVSWIEVLEAADQLKSRLAQVERERDAMIRDNIPQLCDTCKYGSRYSFETPCNTCNHLYRFNAVERGDTDNWEYVGLCTENTKEDSK